jgi:hypothetical protein
VWQGRAHPSDRALLSAIDNELSPRRRTALDAHLAVCAPCRSRQQKMASRAAEVSRVYHDEFTPEIPCSEVLRRRVAAGVRDHSAALDRSWRFRILETFTTVPRAALVGTMLVMSVIVGQLLRPSPESTHAEMVSSALESGVLPVRSLTPGATGNADITALCAEQTLAKPTIPEAVRSEILHDYRMERVPEPEYELDYLITPELGGIADRRNVWPERYDSRVWNAHVKDELERLLAQLVCQGRLDLVTAQRDIAANWIAAYKKYFRTDPPIARQFSVLVDDDDLEVERSTGVAHPSARSPAEPLPILVASRLPNLARR